MNNEKIAFYDTKIGKMEVRYSDGYITYLKFALADADLDKSVPNALSDKAILQVNEYLNGNRTEFDLPLKLIGTTFQKKVWQALCEIPYGKTVSYKDIAKRIDNPKAVRAVGMANNKNRIVIVIPCHRVIGSNGKPVGYAGGLDVKQKLLAIERSKIKNNSYMT